jgi:hypothetical protein
MKCHPSGICNKAIFFELPEYRLYEARDARLQNETFMTKTMDTQ